MVSDDDVKNLLSGEGRTFNRAARRRKPPTDNQFTKATNKLKKLRSRNAKTKQQRARDVARARKAREESNPQVS